MVNVKTVAALGVATIFVLLSSSPAFAQINARQLKKNLKQANKLWVAGQTEKALDLYETILNATEPTAAERADALYAWALATLAPDSERHDPSRAGELLDELSSSFSRHPRNLEIRALQHLLEAQSIAAGEAADLRQELHAKEEELDQVSVAQAGKNDSFSTQLKSLQEELAATEKRLRSRSSELQSTKDKLANTEEAFRKLTERCAGRSGP